MGQLKHFIDLIFYLISFHFSNILFVLQWKWLFKILFKRNLASQASFWQMVCHAARKWIGSHFKLKNERITTWKKIRPISEGNAAQQQQKPTFLWTMRINAAELGWMKSPIFQVKIDFTRNHSNVEEVPNRGSKQMTHAWRKITKP